MEALRQQFAAWKLARIAAMTAPRIDAHLAAYRLPRTVAAWSLGRASPGIRTHGKSEMSDNSLIELLVVDDDDEFRDTMVRRFSRGSFHVVDASNGAAALDLVQRRDFDVGVIDMMMPEMSGIEVLERFRDQHVDCEVIVLTGKGTIETAVHAMKLGAFDYLQKPFPLQDLENVIHRAYERHQLRKENQQLKALL
jgi:FixJ family two-component response regulator